MSILSILIAIVLGLLALAFVLYPLYRRPALTTKEALLSDGQIAQKREKRDGLDEGSTGVASTGVIYHALDTSKLAEGEQAARNALQEVELDYQLGNISETDYRTLRERYMRRALVALKSRYDHEHDLDEAIEEQLRLMKEKKQHVE